MRTPQIEQVQRRAACWTISNYDWQASATRIVQDLEWRTLELRGADARLRLFYKVVHGLVAVPLPDYIQYSNRISRYCHSMTFRQVSTSRDYIEYSFPPCNSTVERSPTIHCMLAEPREAYIRAGACSVTAVLRMKEGTAAVPVTLWGSRFFKSLWNPFQSTLLPLSGMDLLTSAKISLSVISYAQFSIKIYFRLIKKTKKRK